MGRFFPFRRPQRGMPISLRGLARGLAKMDEALSGMSIENGRVEWSANDVPHLVFGDDGAGSCPEFIRNVKEIVGDGLPDPDPPPCGHPGNEPGAGGGSDGGDDTDHPGDEPGAGGGDTDHPGDSPSPPSSGDCP
jgi:hypothetical protein